MNADVIVMGAGPTGCAVATWLARGGADVLLVDKTHPAVDVVGESLLPVTTPLLQALGVDMSGFVLKHGATFTRDDDAVRFDFADALRPEYATAWNIQRSVFDERLRDVARAAGARFVHAAVEGLDLPGTVHTSAGSMHARWVVDALGRQQRVARHLGLRVVHPTLRNAAVGGWFSGVRSLDVERAGDVVISAFPGGWFWFLPLTDDTSSAGIVTTPDGPRGPNAWAEALGRCTAAQHKLAGADNVRPLRHHSDFTTRSSALHGDGWVLAGDAASFLDPVFSTGIALGLGTSQQLADALLGDGDLTEYTTAIHQATAAFEPIVHAFYDGSFLDVAFADPKTQQQTVRKAIVSLLAGDVFDPSFTVPQRFGRRFGSMARMTRAASAEPTP